MRIKTEIDLQIDAIQKATKAVPKFVIMGENAYLHLAAEMFGDVAGSPVYPEKYKDCTLIVDPTDESRPPLVVCDPIQEIFMKVRE